MRTMSGMGPPTPYAGHGSAADAKRPRRHRAFTNVSRSAPRLLPAEEGA